MRSIALLLSLFVLALATVPCCAVAQSDDYLHKFEHVEKNTSTHNDDDSSEECSPFYVCGTCTGFTFVGQQAINFTIQAKPIKHNTAYIPMELSFILLNIWQPPKLF